MDVDAFLESVASPDLRLPRAAADAATRRAPETMDALFHLPLLALAVLVIARRMPFRTFALGRNVALLFVEHFAALRRSPHGLGTSLTLRRRCADALAFLEAAGLVEVSSDSRREVTLSRGGKTQYDRAVRAANDLGLSQERVMARIGSDER
jgi:hypothetical protein